MNVLNKAKKNGHCLLLEFNVCQDGYEFASSIKTALSNAELELLDISEVLDESMETLKKMKPECDKIDYILAACSGTLCGVLDIFLVGKPGDSPVGDISDKWFQNRTMDFAKLCGWDDSNNNSLSSAINHLERKFKISYDQRGAGDVASWVFDLNPKNHHFKSLGHNPSLFGLFFSILDQFNNTSHFVSGGDLIFLQEADMNFELRGNDIPSKLFCGIVNWFGHLISDVSGSSGGKARGMGIPSPLWSWTNDVIAIKRKLNIPVTEFNQTINEVALEIYKKGYDARFQAAQAIPVLVNELLVRVIYSTRRLINYFIDTKRKEQSFALLWKQCEPFSNATVRRMLTIAHGTFCMIDAGEALLHGFIVGGSNFNIAEFFMCLNIVGAGRFTFSLYGEANRSLKSGSLKEEVKILNRKRAILDDYVDGLNYLAEIYNDQSLLLFVQDLRSSDIYIRAFEHTIALAKKRKVPEDEILKTKSDIDFYFKGGNR